MERCPAARSATLAVLCLALALPGCVQPASPAVTGCDDTLWAHVYHPNRLQDPDPTQPRHCMSATGVVDAVLHEGDGDVHIRLHLDAGQEGLLNQKNRDAQHGDLVLEPVCVGTVTQTDAQSACAGFQSRVVLPKVGAHVRATGVYVLDTEHGWMELHPVTTIVSL